MLLHLQGKQSILYSDIVVSMLQSAVSELAKVCDGSLLMMALVAATVALSASNHSLSIADVGPWQLVRSELSTRRAEVEDASDCKGPLTAYAMSVQRLGEPEKSVLSILCLFPPAHKLPAEMVRAIWERSQLPEAARRFEGLLRQLKRAAIVNLTGSGGSTTGVVRSRIHVWHTIQASACGNAAPFTERFDCSIICNMVVVQFHSRAD